MARWSILVALPLLATACVSASNNPPGGEDSGPPPSEDGGSQPVTDATLPPDSAAPDSALPDTYVPGDANDAGVDAAVTLIVTNDLGPEPGVLVVFHDATGAVTGTATTGANGTVSQQLAAGSQVTAVLQSASGGLGFVTIQGVQPGDVLTAFDSVNLAFTQSTVGVDAIPDAGALDAGWYGAYIGSCNTTDQTELPLSVGNVGYPCELGGQFPLFVSANVAGTDVELGYAYVKGSTLPLDGGPATVSVPGPWLSDETTPTILSNAEPPLADGGLDPFLRFTYGELAGDVSFPSTLNPAQGDDGGWEATFLGHPSYLEATQSEATMTAYYGDYSYGSYVAIASRAGADASTSASFDLSQALPPIVSAWVDSTDAGTSNQPFVSWTPSGSLASIDGIIVSTLYSFTYADGGTPSGNIYWTILAPPSATSVTYPALPASLGTPAATTYSYYVPLVIAVEASFLAGYGDLRHGFAAFTPAPGLYYDNGGPIAPTLPVDGTLRLSAVTQGGD